MLNRHAAQVFKDLADFQLEKFCTPFPNLDFLLASTRIGRWLVHCISWMVMTLCWTLDIFFANHVLRLFNFGLCSTKTHPVRIGFLAQSGNQPDRIKIFFCIGFLLHHCVFPIHRTSSQHSWFHMVCRDAFQSQCIDFDHVYLYSLVSSLG